jgi:hypothetical protein
MKRIEPIGFRIRRLLIKLSRTSAIMGSHGGGSFTCPHGYSILDGYLEQLSFLEIPGDLYDII